MESYFINYTQPGVSSLKNIAIVPIITRLMAHSSIEKELRKLIVEVNDFEKSSYFVAGHYNFSKVEEIVLKNLSSLRIPKKIRDDVLNYVKPIGLMIIKCIDLRGNDYNRLYSAILKSKCFWTSRGTIDKTRALEQEVFSNDQNVDRGILFSFAIEYCNENCIFEIWRKIPEIKKENYFQGDMRLCYISLWSYWGYCLENKQLDYSNYVNLYKRTDSIYSVMLEIAILRENFLAAKYFWNKLPLEEKTNDNILRLLDQVVKTELRWYLRQVPSELTDIMLLLLSNLSDPKWQEKFFKKHPEVILKSLYNHWPHQGYFLPTINVMWNYLDSDLYVEIVAIIAQEAKERCSSKALLKELWNCTPEKFKECVECSKQSKTIMRLLDIDIGSDPELFLECSAPTLGVPKSSTPTPTYKKNFKNIWKKIK